MASLTSGSVVHPIGSLFDGSTAAGMSDEELLNRFTARRDSAGESAFAALVMRHGPMVFGVCNELLRDSHDAEDAFQAVFLILAKSAHSIRKPDLLSNWLYGVALRTARYARRSRQRKQERVSPTLHGIANIACASAEQSLVLREHSELLHEEIERLPPVFRLPVVLCYLEGLTVHDAARRLRWSHGTLRSRMARAREKLRRALTRRGVVIPVTALTPFLSIRSAQASISSKLCETTARVAIQFVAGKAASPLATAVTSQLLRSTLTFKATLLVLSFLLLGAIATSAAYVTHALAHNEESRRPSIGNRSGHASPQEAASPNPDPARIAVTGRVQIANRKPVSGARVAIVAMPPPLPQSRLLSEPEHYEVLGSATANADGRFRVELPPTVADRDGLSLVVGASGWALTAMHFDDGRLPGSDLTITMEPERELRGRIFDIQGQPITGVSVRVSRYQVLPFDSSGHAPAWPSSATTDARGRFAIHGLGRSSTITIEAASERHARQIVTLNSVDVEKTGELSLTLSPAQVIEVRAMRADNGKPLAGAWVRVFPRGRQLTSTERAVDARTNDQGRVHVIPPSGESFLVSAYAPIGEPYLDTVTTVTWPKGSVTQSVELKFSRGLRVHGTITEVASGKPVGGALVAYIRTTKNNPLPRTDRVRRSEAVSDPAGTFEIVVPSGPGHLLVRAATPDYLHITTTNEDLGIQTLPNALMYPDAIAHINVRPETAPEPVKLQLRRGVTVAGRAIGPDGKPFASAIALGRTFIPFKRNGAPFTFSTGNAPQIKVRDGRFEIPGCDPDKLCTFHFLDRQHQLGAAAEISGRSASNGPTQRNKERLLSSV